MKKSRVVNVKVTKLDIVRGKSGSNLYCPVARAVKRAHNYKSSINVGTSVIDVGLAKYRLPRAIMSWIISFDNGYIVQPFQFKLNYKTRRAVL